MFCGRKNITLHGNIIELLESTDLWAHPKTPRPNNWTDSWWGPLDSDGLVHN